MIKTMRKICLLLAFCLSIMLFEVRAVEAEIDGVFYEFNLLEEGTTEKGTASVKGHSDKSFYKGEIVIPEEFAYKGGVYVVNKINSSAFKYATDLVSVTCANTIKTIDSEAFARSSVRRVILPDSLESMQWSMFIHSTQLEYVKCGVTSVIPNSGAFIGCTSLKKVEIPEENPYYFADDNCIYQKNVTVYDATGLKLVAVYNKNIKRLENMNENTVAILGHVCESDTGLRCVKFPARLRTIERWAFGGTSNLANVTFNDSLICIDAQAFQGCGVESAILPNSLKYIGGGAFGDCQSLKKVYIGSGLKYFAESEGKSSAVNPFGGCKNLMEITVSPDNKRFTAIDNIVYNKNVTDLYFSASGLRTVNNIPNTVTSFVTTAFAYSAVEDLTLPPNLMSMWGGSSFEGSKIKTLRLPETLAILEGGQFFGTSFTDIYFSSPTPCVISDDDARCYLSNTIIHVPEGCAEVYQNSCYKYCKEIIADVPLPEREVLQYRFSDYLQNPYAYATISGTGEIAIKMGKQEVEAYKGQSIASVAAETAFSTEMYAFVSDANGKYLAKTEDIFVHNNGLKAIRFDEPYVITGEEECLLIGLGSTQGIGIEHSHTNVPNSFMLRANSDCGWEATGTTYRLACFVEGKDIPADMRIIESGKVVVEENDSTIILPFSESANANKMYMTATVQNNSNVPVKSYTMSYTLNGVDTSQIVVDTYMFPNETKTDTIAIPLPHTPGNYIVDVVVTGVNGEVDAIPGNGVAQQEALVRAAAYQRNVVVEMGVATWCGNSPRGLDGFFQMEAKYPGQFIPITLQLGGDMPVNDNSYYFVDQRIYATPMAFMNRDFNNSFDPNFAELDKRFATASVDYASAQIGGKACFSRDDNSRVYVSCNVNFDVTATDKYAVSYVLLEDSVGPYDQWSSGGYESMLFNNVARDVFGGEKGFVNSLPETVLASETYSHDMSFDIPEVVQNAENCEVVALVINTVTGEIENACKMEILPYELSGVGGVENESELRFYVENNCIITNVDCEGLKVYTIDGGLVSNKNLAHGIYIVQARHNGISYSQKVVVE